MLEGSSNRFLQEPHSDYLWDIDQTRYTMDSILITLATFLGWGVWNTHPRMLPRVVKGNQKGHHEIPYNLR
jgi:hypothetical protein